MLEDNPFYRETPETEPPAPEYDPLPEAPYDDAGSGADMPVPVADQPQGAAGQPGHSPGVSPYASVPGIAEAPREPASGMLALGDKLDLWAAFALVLVVATLRHSEAFENALGRILKFLRRFALPALALLFAAAFSVFTMPYLFGTGVSGDINALSMLEFGAAIFLNATSLALIAAEFFKARSAAGGGPAEFPGIRFLQLSLWTFLLCALLFLFFTESKIAFMALYFFSLLNAAAMFSRLGAAELKALGKFTPISAGLQLALVGSLVGICAVAIAGALIAGAPLSSPDERKRLGRMLGRMI